MLAVFEVTFYRNADKISLLVLYSVGMQRVNFIHLGFILFFLLFFSVPWLAR